jgi:mannose-6-phosphate isomerase-like protein (cupin superfamily)/rubrerythrin
MATREFEVQQLLKAYRKGLISDDLLETQMKELNGQGNYTYDGKNYASEREMILNFLDKYRCQENFASEFLSRWIEVSDQECVKGGLRTVQQRESIHAQLLEARLRELGGVPQCTVPQEERDQRIGFFGSAEKKDLEKLQSIAAQIKDPAEAIKPLNDSIAQIQDDQHTKELLRTMVDDEMSSVKWLLEACQTLSAPNGSLDVENVFNYRGQSVKMLQKTPQSNTAVFTLPAGYTGDKENTHQGDQILYIVDGRVTARISGKEVDLKAGDVAMIPAGAPHSLRTGSEPLFGFTVFAPPEDIG